MVPESTGFPQAAPAPQNPGGGILLHLEVYFPTVLCYAGCTLAVLGRVKQLPSLQHRTLAWKAPSLSLTLPLEPDALLGFHCIHGVALVSPSTLSASGSLSVLNPLLWLKDRRGEMNVNGLGQEAPHIDPRQVQEPRKTLGLESVGARAQGQL